MQGLSSSLLGQSNSLGCDAVELSLTDAKDPAKVEAAKAEADRLQRESMGNMLNNSNSMVAALSGMMGPTLTENSSSVIKTDSMEVGFAKASLATLMEPVRLDNGGFTGPDFGEIGGNSTNGTSLVQQVRFLVL